MKIDKQQNCKIEGKKRITDIFNGYKRDSDQISVVPSPVEDEPS